MIKKKTQQCGVKTVNGCTGRPHDHLIGNLNHLYQSEESFFGYHPNVLKSGMQKYARRNEVEKGLWCLVEMDLFSMLEWNGVALNAYLRNHQECSRATVQAQARKIRTNMMNRLIVVMSEEVGISAWWMPLKILKLYQKWVENRGNDSSRKFLVDMYLYLTSQKMIRLVSDIRSVYLVPPSYVKPKQVNDLVQIHKGIQARYPGIYSGQSEVGETRLKFDMEKYPSSLHPCIRGIIYNLEQGSDHVFFWVRKIFDIEQQSKVPQHRYVKQVWDILYRFIDQNQEYEFVRETICALHEFYTKMTHKEKPIYLYHAILLLVRRNEIEWNLEVLQIDTPLGEVEEIYRQHIWDEKMQMDEYVMDLHTKKMEWSPNCLERFAREGAYVKNENVRFLKQEYREIYILLKQELDLYCSRGGKIR